MAEKLCGVCQKNEAEWTCHECSIPLCQYCVREVRLEAYDPGQRIKGIVTSALKPAVRKLKVCEKCMTEVEFIG